MRVIIAGSRSISDFRVVVRAVNRTGFVITEVISGAARRGVDAHGESWAKSRGIPILRRPANWNAYGKAAGYRRNAEMAVIAEALIAVWDRKSKGTAHMISIMRGKRKPIEVYDENGSPIDAEMVTSLLSAALPPAPGISRGQPD